MLTCDPTLAAHKMVFSPKVTKSPISNGMKRKLGALIDVSKRNTGNKGEKKWGKSLAAWFRVVKGKKNGQLDETWARQFPPPLCETHLSGNTFLKAGWITTPLSKMQHLKQQPPRMRTRTHVYTQESSMRLGSMKERGIQTEIRPASNSLAHFDLAKISSEHAVFSHYGLERQQ